MTYADFLHRYGPAPSLPQACGTDYTYGHDLAVLLCLARGATRIVEFGTAHGRTTLALARTCPTARIVTVDVDQAFVSSDAYQHSDTRPRWDVGSAFSNEPECERITQVWTNPDPMVPHDVSTMALGGSCDLAYVDSLHTYEGVKRDTEAALALQARVIVWDDVRSGGVPEFLATWPGVVHVGGTRLSFWERR